MPAGGRWADLLSTLALLTLTLSAYGRLLAPNLMLVDYDALVYFYPLRAYAAAAVLEGRLPLWNPSTFMGVPFIANPQTAFFYPFTWLFFWLSVPQAYGLNLLLHVFLAGAFFYTLCRVSLGLKAPASLIGSAAFMLGGVLSGQYGHLNQISAAAWLPLVVVTVDQAVTRGSLKLSACAASLLGLQLLAGHPQQSYMTLVAVGIVCLWRVWPLRQAPLARAVGVVALVSILGAALAAVQLLPTAELTRFSIRGSGLSYRDAIADSLWPWLIVRALLPSFVNDLGSTEWLGYIGVLPLLLAFVAIALADPRTILPSVALVGVGLFLAIGGANPLYPWLHAWVPGIASFRVPARWLLLYTLGAASLAAVGLDLLLKRPGPHLSRAQVARMSISFGVLLALGAILYLSGTRAVRWLQFAWLALLVVGIALVVCCSLLRARKLALPALLLVTGLELWAAGRDLAPRLPVPSEAYAQPRDSTLLIQANLGSDRFLSLASEGYEIKESPDYRERYSYLGEEAIVSFLVAAKRNEVLTPNINLLYGIDDVDGYDGGLLPLRTFLGLASTLVPEARLRSDGVLISRMDSLPPRHLMDLLNLRLVLTGRAKDVEDDGIRYDRSVLVQLGPGERLRLTRVPQRSFTSAAWISSLEGPPIASGAPIARLELIPADGPSVNVPVLLGRDTQLDSAQATGERTTEQRGGLQVLRPWAWAREGDPLEYLARISLPPVELGVLHIVNTSSQHRLNVRALSLLDERDGASVSVVLDDRLARTTFFDTRVYEYREVLPRAYLVPAVIEAEDTDAAEILQSTGFQPRSAAVVPPGTSLALPRASGSTPAGHQSSEVELLEYRPEHVRLRASAGAASLLVLSDAFYPGWKVRIDGQSAELIRTNIALRGVVFPSGTHEVTFSYEPELIRVGALISILAAVLLLVILAGSSRPEHG